jgi:radical SAM-linked protein
MRIRVTFTKTGALIYIGNLDLYTLWERAARRARLPLSYSQGFHPQPKIHFAAPLPLGYASQCEVLDMRLNEDLECAELRDRFNGALPDGVRVLNVEAVEDGAPAVQTQVTFADYTVILNDAAAAKDLVDSIKSMLAAKELPRERRGKRYDLRPLIESLEVRPTPAGEAKMLTMRLMAQEGATGRPDEVLEALGIRRSEARIERTALHFKPPSSAIPALRG